MDTHKLYDDDIAGFHVLTKWIADRKKLYHKYCGYYT